MSNGGKPTQPSTRPATVPLKKGYQPGSGTGKPQSGYQPATGKGAPANPPNQGSGGKKK